MNFPDWSHNVGILLATGPSFDVSAREEIQAAVERTDRNVFKVFSVNNALFAMDSVVDVHFSCNPEWWDYYMQDGFIVRKLVEQDRIQFWTWDFKTAEKYGLNFIQGRWSGGPRNVTSLSQNPNYIHFGHGSGYECLGLMYHYGIRTVLLVGFDMRFPSRYNAAARIPGGMRHFFGEYPEPLQHWPGPSVDSDGTLRGLIELYETIDCKKLGLNIINTTLDSAMATFPRAPLNLTLRGFIDENR